MKVVALLPMKAKSERIKGKNFKDFCGKPLYRWVLDEILKCKDIETVVINTDADDLINSPNSFGEKVLIRKRPNDIRGDLVSMNLIIEDDINNIEADIYLMTHTTNPLLTCKTLETAIDKYRYLLNKKKADSIFSVNKIQTRLYDKKAKAINHDPANLQRTQDLEPFYEENSNIYLFNKDSFFSTKARIGKNPAMFEMENLESIDIDNQEDWDLAALLMKKRTEDG